jgi:hypothetical protein
MDKPFAFQASIISGISLLACAFTMLGFSIYFIVINVFEGFFPLALFGVVCGYFGVALILYAIKLNKAINTVSTILALYPDFEKTVSYDIHTQSSKKSTLLIDSKNKCFIFVLFDHVVPMYAFSDFIGYDVYENETKLFSTTRDNPSFERNLGSAGKRGGNVFTDHVSSLQLIIHLKDDLNPQLVINFLSPRGVDRLSAEYGEFIHSLNGFCSKLDRLLQS